MRSILNFAAALSLAACAQPDQPLNSPSPGQSQSHWISLSGEGELVETERTADFSVIEIRKSPQGSVASSMFALRGACAVLRARGASFVTSEAVPGAIGAYRLRFPNAATPAELSGPAKRVFSRADCSALRF